MPNWATPLRRASCSSAWWTSTRSQPRPLWPGDGSPSSDDAPNRGPPGRRHQQDRRRRSRRAARSSMGTEVRLEGGALLAQRETAAAPGTTVEVTDLFYNTPARKKFLKSPATEFGHVCQAVQRQALAFPKIHFRLTHNGYAVADYPAVPTLRDRVQQAYGAQLVDTCVDLQEEAWRLRLEGLCTRPLETAHTKTPQDLFVNCRWVKNAAIVHALYEGYGTYLARGHQPRFVLSLWVDPRQVDVY